jgi:hypothetical protein
MKKLSKETRLAYALDELNRRICRKPDSKVWPKRYRKLTKALSHERLVFELYGFDSGPKIIRFHRSVYDKGSDKPN